MSTLNQAYRQVLSVFALVVATSVCAQKTEPNGYSISNFEAFKKERWTVQSGYPVFFANNKFTRPAAEAFKAKSKELFDAFLNSAEEADTSGWVGPAWSLNVTPFVTYQSEALVSGFFQIDRYTGGANGSTEFANMTLGLKDGKWTELTFADLVPLKIAPIAIMDRQVLPRLNSLKAARSAIPLGTLGSEHSNKFALTETGLIFLFGKGEVGAGAEGSYIVKVPYFDIRDYGIDKTILRGLQRQEQTLTSFTGTISWDNAMLLPPNSRLEVLIEEVRLDPKAKKAEPIGTYSFPISNQGEWYTLAAETSKIKRERPAKATFTIMIEGEKEFESEPISVSKDGWINLNVALKSVHQTEMATRKWLRVVGTLTLPSPTVTADSIEYRIVGSDGKVLERKRNDFNSMNPRFDLTFKNSKIKDAGATLEIHVLKDGKSILRNKTTQSIAADGWEAPRDIELGPA